ncbi:MAG: hypothetical protein RR895_08910, partial [Hydrogenoanaerobacterium sp.]
AAQAIEHIPMFDTFDDIKRAILDNARKDKSLFDDYFMKYFSQYLDLDNIVGVSDVDPNDLPY